MMAGMVTGKRWADRLTIEDATTSLGSLGGDDIVRYTAGLAPQAVVSLGAGNDLLTLDGQQRNGDGGTAHGGDDRDELRSNGRDAHHLMGEAGNDILAGSAFAATVLEGGSGDDTYVIKSARNSVVEAGPAGGVDSLIAVTDLARELSASGRDAILLDGADLSALPDLAARGWTVAAGIENLTAIVWVGARLPGLDLVGNAAANRLVGDGAGSMLDGGAGDDLLFGQGGDDQLLGGGGVDQLSGGVGGDQLDGGEGDDQLFGGDGDDRLVGGDGQDQLFGDQGDDDLAGGLGDDLLVAMRGSDRLDGGGGDDVLKVGDRAGLTVLTGGEGADRFVIERWTGDNAIEITDFTLGQDRIDLDAWLGAATTPTIAWASEGGWASLEVGAPSRSVTILLTGVAPSETPVLGDFVA